MPKPLVQPKAIGVAVLALLVALCPALAVPAVSSAAPGPVALEVTPSPLDFTKTTVGERSLLEVEIVNEGEEASIEKIAIEGGDSGEFNTSGNTCGALAEGQHCTLSLEFKPGTTGAKQTTAYIRFSAGARPEESFDVTGTAVAPHLSFTPSSYDFGVRPVNSEGAETTLQLENDGEASVQVNYLELANGYNGWGYNDPNCGNHTLAPGQTCSVQVDFGPNETGSFSNELRAHAANASFGAELSGEGARVEIEAAPNPIDFGAATVGSAGSTRTITLTNNGRVATGFFIAIVSGGDSGSFRLLDENCSGHRFLPGATCTAHLRFSPLAPGPATAVMSFFGEGDGPMQLPLTGEGVAPALSISPASFDFGSQAKGSHGGGHSFVVRNGGSSPLQIESASIVGADLDQFALLGDSCSGTSLAAGQECAVRVRFAPEATGKKTAELRLVADAVSLSSSLSGVGVAPPPAAPRVALHWRGVGQRLRGGAAIAVGTASCKVAKRCSVTVTTQLKVTRHPRRGLVETKLANLPKTSIELRANRSRAIEVPLPPAVRELLGSGRATLMLKARWTAGDKAGRSSVNTAVR